MTTEAPSGLCLSAMVPLACWHQVCCSRANIHLCCTSERRPSAMVSPARWHQVVEQAPASVFSQSKCRQAAEAGLSPGHGPHLKYDLRVELRAQIRQHVLSPA